jgi:glycerophosphoryl diester phosphodiesterase
MRRGRSSFAHSILIVSSAPSGSRETLPPRRPSDEGLWTRPAGRIWQSRIEPIHYPHYRHAKTGDEAVALNIAHRGASGSFPENTLSAFRAAIEAGADMCELDVQQTRDGAIVVIHDDSIDRTTDGAGKVSRFTLAELKRFNAAAKSIRGGLETIPTLDEVFEVTSGRCGLNVEIKAKGVEAMVAEIIERHNAIDTTIVSNFDWDSLARIHEIDPAIKFGLLSEEEPQRLIDTAIRMKAASINPRYDLATAELCAAAHRSGLKVIVWTVDAPDAMHILLERGVDGIITNHPERMRPLVAR